MNVCLTLVCQVRCALHVPALSRLILSPHHQYISSPAATCSAAPACNCNHNHWTLSLCPHPITSPVLPARTAHHAVTSHVCISDWSIKRQNYTTRTCEENQDVSKIGIKVKMWHYGAMTVMKVEGKRLQANSKRSFISLRVTQLPSSCLHPVALLTNICCMSCGRLTYVNKLFVLSVWYCHFTIPYLQKQVIM